MYPSSPLPTLRPPLSRLFLLSTVFRHDQSSLILPGTRTAQLLAPAFHKTHRVLLIEKNSHFQHIFAFPRFSVTKGSSDPRWEPTSGNKDGSGIIDKRKAFIPFNPGTFKDCPEGSGWVAQAEATDFTKNKVKLDRKILLDGVFTDEVPYEFLVRVR